MATVIDQRTPSADNSTANTLITAVMLLLLIFLFFYFGLPALRGAFRSPTINVPDKIDINVDQGQPANGNNTPAGQ